ncbi:MAG: DUF2061 domain-containing protein [Alphaproteobacteria bacterium]|nr:DUF2061 domain-containing protein [Alphaproteobacteria bacterium]
MSGVAKAQGFYRRIVTVFAMVFALGVAPASALEVGDVVSNVLSVSGKDIPLPAGPHTVIDLGFAEIIQPGSGKKVNPRDFGPVRRIVLARVEGGLVGDVVEIVTNSLAHSDGWGIASECSLTDIYATLVRHKSGWDVSCLWIKPVIVDTSKETRSIERIEAFATASGVKAPRMWVEAGFRVADRQDLVDVRYRFAATTGGRAVTTAEMQSWDPGTIAERPGPLGVVQAIAEWASAIYPAVEIGFRTALEKNASFSTPFQPIDGHLSDREQRLSKLTALHDDGTLSDTEFTRQKAIIDNEVEAPIEKAWTHESVAGYKAVTYRLGVTTINVGIDYFFIGQPFAAGVLVILQVVVNTTKFFFHEVMWQELLGVGPLQREEPRIMDFTIVSMVDNS